MLQRQKILSFIYPIYNHNWRNISTIYIYNKTSIKRNILTIKQNISGSRSGKELISTPCTIHVTPSEANNPMNRIDIKSIPYRIIDLTDMPSTGTSPLIAFAEGHSDRMYVPRFVKISSCELLVLIPHWKEQSSVASVLQTGRTVPLNELTF